EVVKTKYRNKRRPKVFKLSEVLLTIPEIMEANINGIITICINRIKICPGNSSQFANQEPTRSETNPVEGFNNSPSAAPSSKPTTTRSHKRPFMKLDKCTDKAGNRLTSTKIYGNTVGY